MVWAHGQTQWKGKNYCSFLEEVEKSCSLFYNVFLEMISIPTYCNSFGYQKLSQHQHFLLLWWSGTALRPLKSGIQKHISPRINFCLAKGVDSDSSDSGMFQPPLHWEKGSLPLTQREEGWNGEERKRWKKRLSYL